MSKLSKQRYISTSFWTDRWIRSLDPSERYLYLYLITNPETNIAGVYKLTIDRIAFDTGYDERTLKPMLQRFTDAGKAVFYHDEWVIIPSWPNHQRLDTRSKLKAGVENIIKELPPDVVETMISYGYPIDTLSIPHRYDTNYSDRDSDSDSDLDSDSERGETRPLGSFVKIPEHLYESLVEDFGEETVTDYAERVDLYCQSKGKRYKDYSATIRAWLKRDGVQKRRKTTFNDDFIPEIDDPDYERKSKERLLREIGA